MSRLYKLTMPLPFIQNFHQINFPPADLLPAFLGLPQTFYCLLPLCEPGHQAWWSNSDQRQAVYVVSRTVLGMSLTPCRSFLLNSCMFGFSESLNFQHRVWSREERGCVAPGTCAQCRGPKGCKGWGCVSAWMHRGKQGVCFQLAYKCLQMESAVVLAPFQCLPGRTLPRAVPLCEQVRVLQQGLRCSCTHRWPQYLAASVSFLLVRGVTDTAQGTAGKQGSVGKA